MILPKQPEDVPLGFKIRRKNGNWAVFDSSGKRFNGRFQTITKPQKVEASVGTFLALFS